MAKKRILIDILLCFATLVCILADVVPIQQTDMDLWGRLAIGAIYFQTGSIPTIDYLSFTAWGKPWVDHEWLSGVIFYALVQHGGEEGLMVFKYLMILVMVGLVILLHRKCYQVTSLWGFYTLALLSPLFQWAWMPTIRAQFFTFLGLLAFILILEWIRTQRKNPRWLLLLFPLGFFWGQCHGGFLLGLILMVLYGLGEVLNCRKFSWSSSLYGIIPVAILAAIYCLNPYGPLFIEYLLNGLFSEHVFVSEWAPTPLLSVDFWEFKLLMACMLIGVGIGVFKAFNQKEAVEDLPVAPWLVILLVMAMAVKSIRFQPLAMLTAIAYLPLVFTPVFKEHTQWKLKSLTAVFQWMLPAAITVSALLSLVTTVQHVPLFQSIVPDGQEISRPYKHKYTVGHAAFLQQSGLSGNIITPQFSLGEFMFWNLYPRFKVSLDSRNEAVFIPEQVIENFMFFYGNPANRLKTPMQSVKDWGADFILFPNNSPTMQELMATGEWEVLFADRLYFLVGKKAMLPLTNGPVKKSPAVIPAKPPTQWYTLKDFWNPEQIQQFSHYGPEHR